MNCGIHFCSIWVFKWAILLGFSLSHGKGNVDVTDPWQNDEKRNLMHTIQLVD